jgi:signal transduction histidine kinase
VSPRNAATFYASSKLRSSLYLAMLTVVLTLLASGGYLVTRTVRRELEVARMKSEFVATVSHEFRSPLTGIRQLSEMLVCGRVSDPAKQHQYHESILHESERLGRLVGNILDFARMEDGRKQYRFEALDAASWLTAVAEEFRADAARAGYRLESSIEVSLPPIAADREALTTAVRNLLENAMKYSPESNVVWLEAQATEGGVLIRVRDQGVGIPSCEQERVFEKFYRGQSELTHKVKGVGLGLSLVKHIVDAHRGRIRLESHEGAGSTFSIHLAGVP